jgi:phage-related protein
MKSYNSAAQLVSTEFANQLPDAMQYLSKVSAATGQDMGFMLDSLVKGVGRVSPMILDNLGIQVNATEAMNEYAASHGKAADQLTKTEAQAAIMAKTLELLKKNTAAMPDITDNVSTKWGQFQTKLANFKDDIGVKLLPFFETVISLLSNLADSILPVITPIIEQVSGAFSTFVGVLGNFQNILANQGIGEAIASLINPLWQLLGLVSTEDMAVGAENIATGIVTAFLTVKDFFENKILPPLQVFASWFTQQALPAIVNFVTGTVVPAIGRFVEILRGIWDTVSPVLFKVVDWFITTGLPLAVGFIRDTMIPYVQKLIDGIMVIWEKVQPGLQSLFNWFVNEGLPAITGFIETTAMPIINTIIGTIGDIWTTVAPALGDLAAWFLEDALPGVIDFIKTVVIPAVQSIIDILKSIWSVAQPYLSSFKDGVTGIMNDVKNALQPVVDFVNGLVTKIKELKDTIAGGVGALGGAADNAKTAAALVSSGQVSPGDFFRALGNAIGSEIGHRAGGGSVYGGGAYIVGEQGPELFTPSTSGNISTAQQTAGMMGGMHIGAVNVYANSYAEGQAAAAGFMDKARSMGYSFG